MTNPGSKISAFRALRLSFFVVIVDQLTKIWVRSDMTLGESRRVLGENFFRMTFVQNTGIAFGLQAGGPIFLIVFSLAATAVLIYLLLRHMPSLPRLVQIAVSLILGGAVGNLIDRVLFGKVTDFLDFDFPNFIMTRWPIFNVADSSVTIGIALWFIYLLFSPKSNPEVVQPSRE